MIAEPIFVVGCPRSGTGLLRDLLRAHPAIAIPGESHFIPQLFRSYGDPRSDDESLWFVDTIATRMGWQLDLDRVAAARLRSCAAAIDFVFRSWAEQSGKQRWGDKTPRYALEIDTLRALFPRARIIHIYRDGRDVWVSLRRSHIGPENTITSARSWCDLVTAGRAAGQRAGADGYHEVRFEQLLDRPEETMRDVCEFIGEPFTRAVLRPRHLAEKARPLIFGTRQHDVVSTSEIVSTNQGRWKTSMTATEVADFESIAGDLLDELGYPTGDRRSAARTARRAYARLHHALWYGLYRLNTADKREWAALTLWMWRAKLHERLRRTGLSGRPPGALPVLGHGPAFVRDKLGFLADQAGQQGPVAELQVGGPTLLLNDPEDIAHVLIANHRNYAKSERLTSRSGRRLAGNSLLTKSPEDHPARRRLLRPLFHRRIIARFGDLIVRNTREMVERWTEDGPIDAEDELARLTRRNVVGAVLSIDTDGEAAALDRAIVARQRYIEYVFGSVVPFPQYRPVPANLANRRAAKTIDRFLFDEIRQRRHTGLDRPDLLSMLLSARREDGTRLTDTDVRDEARMFMLTGYETVGQALTWTLYLLSRNPGEAARARAEVDEVLDGRAATIDDLPRLGRVKAVIDESMRLYPPTWIQVRRAVRDDALPSGAAIPAGSKIYLCQWVTHRTNSYFDDPETFDPDRFVDTEEAAHPRHSYFPFGLGPRRCLGETLAAAEAPLVLATILHACELTTEPRQTVAPHPGVILRTQHGFKVRCRPRSRSPRTLDGTAA